jgi:hypothetical protein
MIGVIVPSVSAIFPDPEKDPKEYVISYYTEPDYQKWFDANFPNDSIEDKVGYPYKIVTNEYYVDSVFDFAIKIPTNAYVVEHPKTVSGVSRSLVDINFEGYGDHGSVFNIHYRLKNVDTINYDDLLHWYSGYPSSGSPYIQQTKINDQSLKQNDDGMYQVRYDYVQLVAYPEDFFAERLAGVVKENQMSKVILLYPNGDQYLFTFVTSPEVYSTTVKKFNESLDSFYSGKTKTLSSITNTGISNIPTYQTKNQEPTHAPEPAPLEIASFVDTSKDPQSYVDRYSNEPTYKQWFDENYSQYSSIYEAVGLEKSIAVVEPIAVVKPLGIASFVDTSKDPQSYVDRYSNEPTYKQWFDENYSQYSSIYEAVGLEESAVVSESVMAVEIIEEYTSEPTVEVVSVPNCGVGTESVNGICQIIQTEEKSSGGGCLIATATYGSEMSTEVQQLRELRDNQLLNTESGTAFMGMFNDVYYSFSPTIADMERENSYFKEAVKLAITPMISSLSLMENANSESEVLSIGISVIVLNLGMYLGVPVVLIVGIRKINHIN